MENYQYQVGGSLPPDSPIYVLRPADDELYKQLKKGQYCYVFNSRQMGKSSLLLKARKRLQTEGSQCAIIDLSEIGGRNANLQQWYESIIYKINRQFKLFKPEERKTWRQQQKNLSPVQRLGTFIEEVLLEKVKKEIFIFIDEIDNVISLPFSRDDFFSLIRSCYNKRSHQPKYKRLTFAFFGVATPTDLIKDRYHSPFNIGRSIDLQGFYLDAALPLAKGLESFCDNPYNLLQKILVWTGGQPFLTQKICQLVVTTSVYISAGTEAELVEQLVQKKLLSRWEETDHPQHLKTIRDRLLKDERQQGKLLGLYKKILKQGNVTADDSVEQVELRLSGLVIKTFTETEAILEVYNPIYSSVFNLEWTNKILDNLRPYSLSINAWFASEGKEESKLLRNRTLDEALAWAERHKLSEEDYQFLSASQELETQKVRDESIKKKKAIQALEKSQRNLKKLSAILIASSILAATILVRQTIILSNQKKDLETKQQLIEEKFNILNINNKAHQALRKFEMNEQQLSSLLLAIKTGTKLSNDGESVDHVKFSPDGKYLAKVDEKGRVIILNLSDQSTVSFNSIPQQNDQQDRYTLKIRSITFNSDGNFATARNDGIVQIWNRAGEEISTFEIPKIKTTNSEKILENSPSLESSETSQEIAFTTFDFSPNGGYLVTTDSSIIRIWDYRNRRLIYDLDTEQSEIYDEQYSSPD